MKKRFPVLLAALLALVVMMSVPALAEEECTHENTTWQTVYDNIYEEIIGDNLQHLRTDRQYEVEVCNDCGQTISRELISETSYEQMHYYDDSGLCVPCGHVNTCTHENMSHTYYFNGEVTYEKEDVYHHLTCGTKVEYDYCPDCGINMNQLTTENAQVEDTHYYIDDGVCEYCGQVCDHPNGMMASTAYVNYRYSTLDNSILYHQVEYDCIRAEYCEICGAVVYYEDQLIRTETEKQEHYFNSENVCEYCSAAYSDGLIKAASISLPSDTVRTNESIALSLELGDCNAAQIYIIDASGTETRWAGQYLVYDLKMGNAGTYDVYVVASYEDGDELESNHLTLTVTADRDDVAKPEITILQSGEGQDLVFTVSQIEDADYNINVYGDNDHLSGWDEYRDEYTVSANKFSHGWYSIDVSVYPYGASTGYGAHKQVFIGEMDDTFTFTVSDTQRLTNTGTEIVVNAPDATRIEIWYEDEDGNSSVWCESDATNDYHEEIYNGFAETRIFYAKAYYGDEVRESEKIAVTWQAPYGTLEPLGISAPATISLGANLTFTITDPNNKAYYVEVCSYSDGQTLYVSDGTGDSSFTYASPEEGRYVIRAYVKDRTGYLGNGSNTAGCYVGTCEHDGNTYTDYEWSYDYAEIEDDNWEHRYFEKEYEIVYCQTCGQEIERQLISTDNWTQSHTYDSDGVCTFCGHVNTCEHNSGTTRNWYFEDETYTDNGDGTHTIKGTLVQYYICDGCNIKLDETRTPDATEVRVHNYNSESKCQNCGAECRHEAGFEEGTKAINGVVSQIDGSNQYHQVVYDLARTEYCPVCGKTTVYEDEIVGTTVKKESHNINDEGKCEFCGAQFLENANKTAELTLSATQVSSNEPITVTLNAPDANWAELIISPNGWYSWNGFGMSYLPCQTVLSLRTSGTYDIYAIAYFDDGDNTETNHITVECTGDGQYEGATGITIISSDAGGNLVFSIDQLTCDGDYIVNVSGWKDGDDSGYFITQWLEYKEQYTVPASWLAAYSKIEIAVSYYPYGCYEVTSSKTVYYRDIDYTVTLTASDTSPETGVGVNLVAYAPDATKITIYERYGDSGSFGEWTYTNSNRWEESLTYNHTEKHYLYAVATFDDVTKQSDTIIIQARADKGELQQIGLSVPANIVSGETLTFTVTNPNEQSYIVYVYYLDDWEEVACFEGTEDATYSVSDLPDGRYQVQVRAEEAVGYIGNGWNSANCYVGTCDHSYGTYTDNIWSDSYSEIAGDNRYHAGSWSEYEITYCDKCGQELSREEVNSDSGTWDHSYNDDGVCTQCGHVNTCTHEGTTETWWRHIDETYVYEDYGSNKYHQATCQMYEEVHCASCGILLSEDRNNIIEDTWQWEHNYDSEGVCYNCGHVDTGEINKTVTLTPGVTEVMTCEDYSFTVMALDADYVELWVAEQGDYYMTTSFGGGKQKYVRHVNNAREMVFTARAYFGEEYVESDPLTVTVTAPYGPMAEPVIIGESRNKYDGDLTLGVTFPEGCTDKWAYLYSDHLDQWYYDDFTITIPADDLDDEYTLRVDACAVGYEPAFVEKTIYLFTKDKDDGHTHMALCGQDEAVCRFCGATEADGVTIELEHDWTSDLAYNEESHWTECWRCGERLTAAHTYNEDGICEECGYRQPMAGVRYDWDDVYTVTAIRGYYENGEYKEETETVSTIRTITKAPTCEEMGEATYTAEFSSDSFETQTKTVTDEPALGHDWSEATYTWSEDNSTVTATRTCLNDAAHVETETVSATYTVIKEATCEEDGEAGYLSEAFTNTAFEQQSKAAETIAALGHAWSEVTYTWSEDFSSVTATRVCANDASHVETETVAATAEVITAATCEEDGLGNFVSGTFTNPAFATQTKEGATIPALGHDWSEASYEWNGLESVTATRTCGNDATHVETETAAVTGAVTKAATCEEDGETTYTAAFANAAFAAQTQTIADIPALGHAWSEVTYTWSEDNSAVTATRTCANDTAHVETETVATTVEIIKAATCEEDGLKTFTSAAFTNGAFAVQVKENVAIPALGHDWSEAAYEWEGLESVTATRSCLNDATHVETETAAVTGAVTKAATCEEAGETTYTAAFENAAFETQAQTIADIPALGHDWGEATYTWSEDNTSVTAARVCANDASHVETETVATTVEVITAAACEADGVGNFTSGAFTNAAFAQQTKDSGVIPKTGHTVVIQPAVAATKTATGLTEGKYCSVCGKVLAAQEVVPKLPVMDINATTFPDAAFRTYILNNIDTTKDSKLNNDEIAAVTSINLAGSGVSSLSGIATFTNLTSLNVSNNQLIAMDLSGNGKLTSLTCTGNTRNVTAAGGMLQVSTLGLTASKMSAVTGGTLKDGIITVLASGNVSYTYDCGGGKTATFTLNITGTKLAISEVKLAKTSYAYKGEAIKPKMTVTADLNGTKVELTEDQYTVTYKNNKKAGTATVTVKGAGLLEGTVKATFKITQVKLASAKLQYTKTAYTGKALKPTATVKAKVNGKTVTLTKGTDYTITYKNNKAAGKATVTIKGKGNFTGTLTKTFTITKVKLGSATLQYTTKTYTGKALTPKVTVKATVNGKTVTLKKGTDYTVTYKNNTKVGTATVVIKGTGNYTGTIKLTFKITK